MATRQVVQKQNKVTGEAEAMDIKQKKMAADRKTRRALGDIGNVITVHGPDGKPIPQVSRPVTRGYCAKLLANAQAAAAENNKDSLAADANSLANGARPEKRAVARKPAQKKAASKTKPGDVIVIIPDSSDVVLEKAGEKSSKKKAPTLTSTLTARSKAACGMRDKPKEEIVDIDAADIDNDLAVVEYVEEMYKFYKSVENDSRAHGYMDMQPDINEKMREILIDWLIQVHQKFDLSTETLYLTVNIIDRFLASKTTTRKELQLVGLSAMLLASKYEEIWAPEVDELVCMSNWTYTNKQVLVMEKQILGELEWNITVPTPYVFLVRFIKASMTGPDVESMVYFLAELGMTNYATLVYSPSMVAASAVYAARRTLNKAPFWNRTLKMHTGYSEPQLMDCVKLLVTLHSMANEQKLPSGVYRKYACFERGAVALVPPAKSLLAASFAQ